jgi:hypothetical protein
VILATVERLAKPCEPRAVHMHAGCFPVFKRMGRPIITRCGVVESVTQKNGQVI